MIFKHIMAERMCEIYNKVPLKSVSLAKIVCKSLDLILAASAAYVPSK